jgi:hypothetical protein
MLEAAEPRERELHQLVRWLARQIRDGPDAAPSPSGMLLDPPANVIHFTESLLDRDASRQGTITGLPMLSEMVYCNDFENFGPQVLRRKQMRKIGLIVGLIAAACGSSGPNTSPPDAAIVIHPDANPNAPDAAQPDAKPKVCDPETGAMCSGGTPKCAVVTAGLMCVAETGTTAEGGTCTRTGGMVGIDDCASGLFCSGVGFPAPATGGTRARVCRKYCAHDSDCATSGSDAGPTDDWCALLDSEVPPDGICVPGCQLFSGTSQCTGAHAGESCELDLADIDNTVRAECRSSKTGVNQGDSCGIPNSTTNPPSDENCAAGQDCLTLDKGTTFTCQQICDNNNACATGSCTTLVPMGGFNGIGFCM